MPSDVRSPQQNPHKAEKAGAPEWNFADEEVGGAGAGKNKNSMGHKLGENKFFFRAVLGFFFVICAVYAFNFKEAAILNKTYKKSTGTWFSAKPLWQTTEELRQRMQPHEHRQALLLGESYEDTRLEGSRDTSDKEEWLGRLDMAAESDLKDAGIGDIMFDYGEY
jgi:hypothetical protein